MKLIALVPVKDEEWILPAFLSSVLPAVDEIVAVDNNSTDRSRRLLLEAGAHVETNASDSGTEWSENLIREQLLELGRGRGGTHFLCLDADEALTAPALTNLREVAKTLKPSEKIAMQWLALWKSPRAYRDDKSVWSNNYKDFLFSDDGILTYVPAAGERGWGTLRTPGQNDPSGWITLRPDQAAVAHFQFVPWRRFQAKQAWYRCCELVSDPNGAIRINAMYAPTLDDPSARLKQVPEGWLESITVPAGIADMPAAWHLEAIRKMFATFGCEHFEPLQIWHVPELREDFIATTGREPRSVDPGSIRARASLVFRALSRR